MQAENEFDRVVNAAYRIEMGKYTGLYRNCRQEMSQRKMSRQDRDHYVCKMMTILFMRFVCKRRYNMNWFLLRKTIEMFIRKYNPRKISMEYIHRHYRGNPEEIPGFLAEFNVMFDTDIRAVESAMLTPLQLKIITKNKVGGHRHAGAYI